MGACERTHNRLASSEVVGAPYFVWTRERGKRVLHGRVVAYSIGVVVVLMLSSRGC